MKRGLSLVLVGVLVSGAFVWGVWTGHSKAWPFDPLWRTWRAARGVPIPFADPRMPADAVGLDDGLAAPADVVMLGDSITALGRWSEYWPELRVANRGIGGETAADLSRRLHTVFAVKPQLVVLLIGTNDVSLRNDNAVVARDFEALARTISARTHLVLVTVPPCVCSAARNDAVVALNGAIRRTAAKQKIALIDLYAALVKDGGLDPAMTTDGIHLNANGYGRWRALLSRHLPTPRGPS